VRGGASEQPEGKGAIPSRGDQFTDYATALACYRSPEYEPLGRSGAARRDRPRYCGRLRRAPALRLPAASRSGWQCSIEQRHFGIDMRAARMSEARGTAIRAVLDVAGLRPQVPWLPPGHHHPADTRNDRPACRNASRRNVLPSRHRDLARVGQRGELAVNLGLRSRPSSDSEKPWKFFSLLAQPSEPSARCPRS